MSVSTAEIIDFFLDSRPVMIWEMDKQTLEIIKHLRDDNGMYLWVSTDKEPNTFAGLKIVIKNEKCFQLRCFYKNGFSFIQTPNFTI